MEDHKRLDELRRRVEKDPASIAFASLAEELRKVGEYDEAVRVCRTGLERHPTYLSAHVTLGRALLALQHYAEARTEIEYVLHAAPDNLLALKCLNELEAHPSDAPKPPGGDGGPEPASPSLSVQSVPEPAKPDLRIQASPEPPQVEPPVAAFASPKPPSGDGGPELATPNLSVQSVPEPAKPDLRIQTSFEPPEVEPPVAALAAPQTQSGDGGPVAEALAEPARVEPPVAAAAALEVTTAVEASSNGGPPAEHPAVAALEDWQARIQADRARRNAL